MRSSGLTTAPTDADSRQRLCTLVAAATDAAEVWLADDAVTTHAGALSLGWGVSVVAGTGVACLAVPEQGAARIIGGHGYLLGDEGGAFWIGREALRAVLRAEDGRGPTTALAAAAARRFDGLDDLGDRLHSARRPVNDIAQFAPDVLAVAEQGDRVAEAIVDEAVGELVLLIRAGVAAIGGAVGRRRPTSRDAGRRTRARARRAGWPAPGRDQPASTPPRWPAAVGAARGRCQDRGRSPLDGAIALGRAGGPGPYRDLVHLWRQTVAA